MKTHTIIKTIKTVCGKTITYFQKDEEAAKMHSMEGPAVIYPKEDKKASEYYIFGIRYSKNKWQDLVNQHKAVPTGEPMRFDF